MVKVVVVVVIEFQDNMSVKWASLSHTKSILGDLEHSRKLMTIPFQWIYAQPNIPYSLVRVKEIRCCATVLDLVGSCNRVEVRVQVVHALSMTAQP